MNSNRLSVQNTQRAVFRKNSLALAVALAVSTGVQANPSGLSVVAGQATTQTIGNLMQVTNTPGAILNWHQFNIDVGQTTQFIQQSAASQVFNRVTGGDASQILGTLKSNGQVFLINPAGVFFGQGAVVDTAGFLASTLAASDTDLLNGHLRFKDNAGNAGAIVNQGQLKTHSGGSVVLLAPNIENSGVIHAEGEVLLAAGHSVTIVDLKHPTIGVTLQAKAGDKALNLGQIISRNASLFSHLVEHRGLVQASAAQVGEGGVVRFVAQGDALVSGVVRAEGSGGKGGEIDITGQRVAVLSGAVVSADGAAGGGTVHVGGGWQGRDESIANARETVVQVNTKISANATQQGNGGEVVVWADGHTTVDSEVQAKGGALGGDGGRVETSGKESLAVGVAANTSAPKGKAGQWLIDPANLTIVDTIPQNGFVLGSSSQEPPVFSTDDINPTFSPTESFLLASTVVDGLENNGSVEIYTTGNRPGTGNLTVSAPVLVDEAFYETGGLNPKLFLEAKGDLNINAAVGLAPGQDVFGGFDLVLSYDITEPVYINAPVYLGDTGQMVLAPYDVGNTVPVSQQGQLPADGVNLLAGMNSVSGSEPLNMNQITVVGAIATDPTSGAALSVQGDKNVKLNVLGANLKVNNIFGASGSTSPGADVRVGRGASGSPGGALQYTQLTANSLTVEAASSVSTFTNASPGDSGGPGINTSLNRLDSEGTVQFNGGSTFINELNVMGGNVSFLAGTGFFSPFHRVDQINTSVGGTINVLASTLSFNRADLNGVLNVFSDIDGRTASINGVDVDLNGTITLNRGNTSAFFLALGMGADSRLTLSEGSYLGLGNPFSSFNEGAVNVAPKQPGAYISRSGGQFVAEVGAEIIMNGADAPVLGDPPLQSASFNGPSFGGAIIDVTGLDGRLDAPVRIESNGYFNSIYTDSASFSFNPESGSGSNGIDTLRIEAASIEVNAGGAGEALSIGGLNFGSVPNGDFFGSPVDLDFNGSLVVNSGTVRLHGDVVSLTDGELTVNGSNSMIGVSGKFTTADLMAINRVAGGRLAADGFWDNTAVTTLNLATASPLTRGKIEVEDELVVSGGVLAGSATGNALEVKPGAFLELRNTEVRATVNVSPTGVVMLGAQDENGVPTAPVVLDGANFNMGGDTLFIVESDANGVASLDGRATITSGSQGNLILAGRKGFSGEQINAAPNDMQLTVGENIRLNVTGNAPGNSPALALYYAESNTTPPPQRPVFLVGQLTPEAVAVTEFVEGNVEVPARTTVLSGFEGNAFVIDGTPDQFTEGNLNCTANNLCVKFDVAQALDFNGMVMTTLGEPSPSLATSGVQFVAGADLQGLQFAMQTATQIQFLQGVNMITAADLMSGKSLLNAQGSTVVLGSNQSNETLSNDFINNGNLQFDGIYTLNGLISGSGNLKNSGNLTLSNASGSVFGNSIENTGTLTNTGFYTVPGLLAGNGTFVNMGTMNFGGAGQFQNTVNNMGGGILNFTSTAQQGIQFVQDFQNAAGVLFNGGQYTFGSNGYAQSSGITTMAPGTILNGNLNFTGGDLRGFANINGNVNLAGTRFAPGASPGLMTVSGDLNLDANSIIDIEVLSDGGVSGTDFDCIVVSGTANLAGQLNLIDISQGTLQPGNEYTFLQASTISGGFANVSYSPASGSTYNFVPPQLVDLMPGQGLRTTTASITTPPVEMPTMPGTMLPTSGTTDSAVAQNLNQAFVPQGTETAQPTATPAEQEQAVEVANQSTGGTTMSQQSQQIELRSSPSNPQRAAAICK